MRLFLDANVLFTAAHNPAGKAAFLLLPAQRALWAACSSAYAVEEARRNLARKRPAALDRLDELLASIELVRQPAHCPAPILALPAKDQPIWFAAWAAKASHLLTGDIKDFGPHMNRPAQTDGIVIQTVAEFLSSFGA